MDQKELDVIIEALNHAVRIIGLATLGKPYVKYEDFRDTEIRDMYYKINDMCLVVHKKKDEKQENNTAECG